jgi:hypothetical protein
MHSGIIALQVGYYYASGLFCKYGILASNVWKSLHRVLVRGDSQPYNTGCSAFCETTYKYYADVVCIYRYNRGARSSLQDGWSAMVIEGSMFRHEGWNKTLIFFSIRKKNIPWLSNKPR